MLGATIPGPRVLPEAVSLQMLQVSGCFLGLSCLGDIQGLGELSTLASRQKGDWRVEKTEITACTVAPWYVEDVVRESSEGLGA